MFKRGCFKIIGEAWLRLKLFFFGVRFYEGRLPDNAPLTHRSRVEFGSEKHIELNVYSIPCVDVVLRRGHLSADTFRSYVVEITATDNLPTEYHQFDGRYYFFNGRVNQLEYGERQTSELLVDIWCDMLRLASKNWEKA